MLIHIQQTEKNKGWRLLGRKMVSIWNTEYSSFVKWPTPHLSPPIFTLRALICDPFPRVAWYVSHSRPLWLQSSPLASLSLPIFLSPFLRMPKLSSLSLSTRIIVLRYAPSLPAIEKKVLGQGLSRFFFCFSAFPSGCCLSGHFLFRSRVIRVTTRLCFASAVYPCLGACLSVSVSQSVCVRQGIFACRSEL